MTCLSSFESLCRKVISPTRHKIDSHQLINRKFRNQKQNYEELHFANHKNHKLALIAFIKNIQVYPTILYLHGNGGYKLQCLQLIQTNNFQFNLISFDFQGCGESDGQYLHYGQQEVEDIGCVIHLIRRRYRLKNKIYLWGRSMGASLALLYAASNQSEVECMILDTPFRSMEQVFMNIAEQTASNVPRFILSIVMLMMKGKIKSMCGVDIFAEDFLEKLSLINNIPILFAYSTKDTVVKEQNVKQLYSQYKGPKNLTSMKVLHHEDRPKAFICQAWNFIEQNRKVEDKSSMLKKKQISISELKKKKAYRESLKSQ